MKDAAKATAKTQPPKAAPAKSASGRAASGKASGQPTASSKPAASKPAATRPVVTTAAVTTAAVTKGLTLLFIRHADAGDAAAWTGDDADRPLSKKGRRQAKRLGDLLDRLRVRPEAILTSPRVRAADTAKLVGRRVGREWKVEPRLDAGFGATALASIVAELDGAASTIAIVGHDPDFSTLASWLVDAPIALSKGALVRVELPERTVGPGKGTLLWLLPPDAVPG